MAVTETVKNSYPYVKQVKFVWTSAADGSESLAAENRILGWVFMGVTIPGTGDDAPSDNYDIVLNDSDGCDIFGSKLLNRSQTLTQQATPDVGGVYASRFVDSIVTFGVTNAGANNKGTLIVYYYEDLA